MQERILKAAADVLAQLPLSKITMDDIARTAGVARQTIYKHFPNRDALIVALLVDETERTHRPALQALHAKERSAEQLTRLIVTQIRLAGEWVLLSRTFDPRLAPRIAELVLSADALADCVNGIWLPILADYCSDGLLRQGLDLERTVRWLTYQYVWFLSYPDVLTDQPEDLGRYVHSYITGALVNP
ncbi:MAG: TetR/AcrR family transcriptional regulator [Actinomycetota bacterium]